VATDNHLVERYDIVRNGALLSTVVAPATAVELSGLPAGASLEIEVYAVDVAGNRSLPLSLLVNPSDTIAPAWPTDASISVSELTSTFVTMGWPSALDNVAIEKYVVGRDGEELATLEADTTWITVAVEPFTTPTFSVHPVDSVGNVGTPLTVEIEIPDGSAPEWPQGSALGVAGLSETSLDLAWPSATDDVAITSYVIRKGATELATVPGNVTAYAISGLEPWTVYTLSVVALDGAGNSGVPLTVSVKTPDVTEPVWPLSAAVWTYDVGSDFAELAWIPAKDNVAVSGYRIYAYNEMVKELSGDLLTTTVTLNPWTTYSISVRALDEAGNESVTGPSVTVKTTDDTPPSWPDGSALVVTNLTSTSCTLSWPMAVDDVLVVSYRVYAGDALLAATPGDITSIQLDGLVSGSPYNFRVEAMDQAQNLSEVGLELMVETPDGSPPKFPSLAKLTVGELTPTSVALSWPPATDDVGVVAYTIMQDTTPMAMVDGFTTSTVVMNLVPMQQYAFYVRAADAAGNVANGPEVDFVTPADAVNTLSVYTLLRPTCVDCHGSGTYPFFESEAAFINGIVKSPTWVTPGDGSGSGLVQMLSGTYGGLYGSMPPGEASYKDMAEGGSVSLTMQDIEEWIDALPPFEPVDPVAPTAVRLNTGLSAEVLTRSLRQVLGLTDDDFFDPPTEESDGNVSICGGTVEHLPVRSPEAIPGFCSTSPVGRESIVRWYALGGAGYGVKRKGKPGFDRAFSHTYVAVSQAWCRIAAEDPGNKSLRGEASLSDTLPVSQSIVRAGIEAFGLSALGEALPASEIDDLESLFFTYQAESTVAAWTAVCAVIVRDPLFLTY
jgi:hypothetical protein